MTAMGRDNPVFCIKSCDKPNMTRLLPDVQVGSAIKYSLFELLGEFIFKAPGEEHGFQYLYVGHEASKDLESN